MRPADFSSITGILSRSFRRDLIRSSRRFISLRPTPRARPGSSGSKKYPGSCSPQNLSTGTVPTIWYSSARLSPGILELRDPAARSGSIRYHSVSGVSKSCLTISARSRNYPSPPWQSPGPGVWHDSPAKDRSTGTGGRGPPQETGIRAGDREQLCPDLPVHCLPSDSPQEA